MIPEGRWQFSIDRGGTFTDVVARRPDGSIATLKLLSEDPEHYADAAVEGVRRLLGLAAGTPLPAQRIASVKIGTTVATNALLERKGEPTVLVVTRGFRDALRIAYQNRPRLFERHIVLPELLYGDVIEADERIDAQGRVLRPLDASRLEADLRRCHAGGRRAVAIVLMHGWRHVPHERAIADLARAIGFTQVSASHAVSPLMKFVSRGDTTVVDAYLSPGLRRYVDAVQPQLPGVRLAFMQSNGGLADAGAFKGKDAILSGPAGGIVGMADAARRAGFGRVIGFDMGGTSTDVSHFAGEFEREFETRVAGVRLRAPMMSIHTVAAGGGSVLHFDGHRLRVGPDSAGARPGPACYRRGGPLTVTDCNVVLGRIQPSYFPRVFGPGADEPLDSAAAAGAFAVLARAVGQATGRPVAVEELAAGYLQIAVANMANAIKQISVQRGHDVTAYTLVTFGGAGGQHACLVADALGMTRVLIHPLAGVLSAYGIGVARQAALREAALEMRLANEASCTAAIDAAIERLVVDATDELLRHGTDPRQVDVARRVHLRYEGTDTALAVRLADPAAMRQDFERAYAARYAFLMPGRPLVVEAVSVEVFGAADPTGPAAAAADAVAATPTRSPAAAATTRMHASGAWQDAGLHRRDDLQPGDAVAGPALVVEANATTVVEPGWLARVDGERNLVIERVQPLARRRAAGTDADPILLEVFNNLFMSVAEQMGLRLANTAHSVNIKERLDFSCAIFDADGNLVANAPHMPVHLGSMGDSIRSVMLDNAGRIAPGDVFVLNDPYRGGTHLPDVTVVTPVFDADDREILFYVGSRGHHADIGGTTPGSMPADSRTIDDEGVRITNFRLVERGHLREAELRELLEKAPYPARNIEQNLADLRAQVAANRKGADELLRMVDEFGLDVVRAYMGHVQDNAEEAVRRVIGALDDGRYELAMDNGARIVVAIRVDRAQRAATIDFEGTSAQLPDNFNAPSSICTAAVLYVFRTLVDDDIPLNAGCLRPLHIRIPEGSMLNPRHPAAVAAGNVETSSCIVNALYGAIGGQAASQGTMNNFTFGDDRYQYYETIAGGSGAGVTRGADGSVRGFDGCDVVQTQMTNSRLTDPEILEFRYPVLLESYEIRHGSGGAGRWRGGDGGIRRIRFLQEMTASILSNNRIHPPFGAAGGAPGAAGRNRVVRADGRIEELPHVASVRMSPGDTFVIETPGGGGYGAPADPFET